MSTVTAASTIFFIKILWTLLNWFMGNKIKREIRAKELSSLMAKIQKEGDNLGKQIRDELNTYSGVGWENISVREE